MAVTRAHDHLIEDVQLSREHFNKKYYAITSKNTSVEMTFLGFSHISYYVGRRPHHPTASNCMELSHLSLLYDLFQQQGRSPTLYIMFCFSRSALKWKGGGSDGQEWLNVSGMNCCTILYRVVVSDWLNFSDRRQLLGSPFAHLIWAQLEIM